MQSPRTTQTILFGLLRHGETVWNSQHRVQGHGDSPLTPRGRNTTRLWAEFLTAGDWQHILCSDLGRVRETVAIINDVLQLPVTVDARLREQHWGDWEGLEVAEVRRQFAEDLAMQEVRGWDFRPPAGESRREVLERAFAALADCHSPPLAEKVLVICHLGIIKCLTYSVAGCSFLPSDNITIEKGCLQHILFNEGEYRLGPLNVSPEGTLG